MIFRKATKEEIINHFRKNTEPAKESTAPFKVGDEVEILLDNAKIKKGMAVNTDSTKGVLVEVNGDYYKAKVWYKPFELKRISVSNSKEPFTVEGSKYLKEAFCKELIEECGFADSKNSMDTARYLIASSMTQKGITSTDGIKDRHYKLPAQWEEAKQAFIDFYKEDKPTEVSVQIKGRHGVLSKEFLQFEGHKITVKDIINLHVLLYGNSQFAGFDLALSASIGCNEGVKSITHKDTQLILDEHTKYFG